MAEVADAAATAYASAKPFPHVVLDDFFDPELVNQVLAEFPRPGAIDWQRFDNPQEIKLASAAEASFGPTTRLLLYHLNSISFLEFLSKVMPDPCFDGGGLHQIVPGGKLAIHADFNKHPRYGLDRRLNVLLYLNKGWREEFGGHLELWSRDMARREARILPIFNRLMIFGTTDFTYHGHPDALRCPAGMTRKSLALYYFSNGRPADELSGEHSTLWQRRTESEFTTTLGQRMRSAARELLPPIVTRQLRRYL
jgi:hypothetical protein